MVSCLSLFTLYIFIFLPKTHPSMRDHTPALLCTSHDGKFVVSVPFSSIVHMPSKRSDAKSPHKMLGMCRLFQTTGQCSNGSTCKYVHCNATETVVRAIHVSYSWRSEGLCCYKRLPCGEVLQVFAPNNCSPSEEIPSERVLVTQGSLMHKERNGYLSHCAHFHFNRICLRGEQCRFIHAIHVNPNAEENQRAPTRKQINSTSSIIPTAENLSPAGLNNAAFVPSPASTIPSSSDRDNEDLSSHSIRSTTICHNPYGDALRIRKEKRHQ